MNAFLGNFIGGQFRKIENPDGEIRDLSPGDLTDEIIKIQYSLASVDDACEAARRAYLPWARLTLDERKTQLNKVKAVFESRKSEMAEIIARDTGKPLWEALTEAGAVIGKFDITLNFSTKLIETKKIDNALPQVPGFIRYKPRGVMAVLGPFNFPLHLPNGHIVPALLAGNTVVFKPSEQTPAAAQFYAECFQKAELPAGVFNLVHGPAEIGRKLSLDERVDGILFTGSYEVGLKIKQETLTHYWKIHALEMGGKNATVVWDDADFDKALYESLIGAFMTTGQRCSGTSRILVHESIADKFIDAFYEKSKKLSIGHWKQNPFMGPLITEGSVEKYLRFQEIAKRENGESLMRGKVLEGLSHRGYYVTPSLILVNKFDAQSVYQKSEIFGPNVAFYRVKDFDETLNMVNSTGYGLAMALFSKRRELFDRAILEARVGVLNYNRTTNGASSKLPFGGMGKSGNDRPSAHLALQYCSVPVASLEDPTPFDPKTQLPGMNWN